jgi:O-succinylbenzoate synthase
MLEISHAVLREIRLSLKRPFQISSGIAHHRRILLVELKHPDGLVGWGECVAGETPHYSPETVDTAWLAVQRWIAPLVVGKRFDTPVAVSRALEHAVRGHPMARAAVEMASWDLAARIEQRSLAALLGGVRERVATGISLGLQETPAELAACAADAVTRGYRRVKVKIEPGRDIEYVAAARGAVGPSFQLSVDANAAYEPKDTELLRQLDQFDLTMIEQPLEQGDLLRHAELQRALATPICLDESITSIARAEDMIALGSGRIINIKPGRVGGFTAATGIHDLACRSGVDVWCGGMLETGVGRAHNVALSSLPHFTLPGDLSPSARYWERDIVRPEWTMVDGALTVPLDRVGSGVDVDLPFVDDITQRQEIVAP